MKDQSLVAIEVLRTLSMAAGGRGMFDFKPLARLPQVLLMRARIDCNNSICWARHVEGIPGSSKKLALHIPLG